MKSKPILIVGGEPFSVFIEIFLKSISQKKIKKKLRSPNVSPKKKKFQETRFKKFQYFIKNIVYFAIYTQKM